METIKKDNSGTLSLPENLEKLLTDCTLCPRNCHVNRMAGQIGYCLQTGTLRAPGRLLWRGENERAMSDDAQAFQEAYRTFLELPSEDDELSAWAAKKAKALETMVNAAGGLLAAVR